MKPKIINPFPLTYLEGTVRVYPDLHFIKRADHGRIKGKIGVNIEETGEMLITINDKKILRFSPKAEDEITIRSK